MRARIAAALAAAGLLAAGCASSATKPPPTPASLLAKVPGCGPHSGNLSTGGNVLSTPPGNLAYVRRVVECAVPSWISGGGFAPNDTLSILTFQPGGEKPWLVSVEAGDSGALGATDWVLSGPGWAAYVYAGNTGVAEPRAAHRWLGGTWLTGSTP